MAYEWQIESYKEPVRTTWIKCTEPSIFLGEQIKNQLVISSNTYHLIAGRAATCPDHELRARIEYLLVFGLRSDFYLGATVFDTYIHSLPKETLAPFIAAVQDVAEVYASGGMSTHEQMYQALLDFVSVRSPLVVARAILGPFAYNAAMLSTGVHVYNHSRKENLHVLNHFVSTLAQLGRLRDVNISATIENVCRFVAESSPSSQRNCAGFPLRDLSGNLHYFIAMHPRWLAAGSGLFLPDYANTRMNVLRTRLSRLVELLEPHVWDDEATICFFFEYHGGLFGRPGPLCALSTQLRDHMLVVSGDSAPLVLPVPPKLADGRLSCMDADTRYVLIHWICTRGYVQRDPKKNELVLCGPKGGGGGGGGGGIMQFGAWDVGEVQGMLQWMLENEFLRIPAALEEVNRIQAVGRSLQGPRVPTTLPPGTDVLSDVLRGAQLFYVPNTVLLLINDLHKWLVNDGIVVFSHPLVFVREKCPTNQAATKRHSILLQILSEMGSVFENLYTEHDMSEWLGTTLGLVWAYSHIKKKGTTLPDPPHPLFNLGASLL